MNQEKKMTEKQFIAKFKKLGFELYDKKQVSIKLKAFYAIQDEIVKVLEKDA